MDPISAIKQRIKELTHELEINNKALALYGETPAHIGVPKLISADTVRAEFAKQDQDGGVLIPNVAKALGVSHGEVARNMKPARDYVQVNKPAKQWKRYRLKTLINGPTHLEEVKDKTEKVREVKSKVTKPKRKTQPRRTSGNKITSGLGKETRDKILDDLKRHKQTTAKLTAERTGLPQARVKTHLDQLVNAETVKKLGADPSHDYTKKGSGRAPILYESLIFVPMAERATIHVSASSSPDKVTQTSRPSRPPYPFSA